MKLILAIALITCLVLTGCVEPTTETNPAKFTEIVDQWRSSGLVDHFPSSIPADAREVQFSAFPGFLQGGAWIQLRYEAKPEDVQRIFAEATTAARQYHDGGGIFTLVNSRPDGLASAGFHTSTSHDNEFPTDYRVFIYDAEPYKRNSGFDWNHGKSKGVAVSTTRNVVVFWAENW